MTVRRRHHGTTVAGFMIALFGAGFMLDSVGHWNVNLVFIWPVLLIGMGASVLLGRAERLEVEEKRSSDLAVAEERVKIAQELHDIVAHSVSLMTVQIAAARRVLSRKPEEAEKALEAAEDTGRKSLDELRRIVGVLRSADQSIEAASFKPDEDAVDANGEQKSPLPGLDQIESLAGEMQEAGLELRLAVEGERPEAAQAAQLAAYRVVQESLTNVLRHSPKASVDVRIRYSADEIDITVEDDGAGFVMPAARRTAAGHGLLGMRERVSAVGGNVSAGPRAEGGWKVEARIPAGPLK